MSQCLHCSRSCAGDALFCENCQDHADEVVQLEILDQAHQSSEPPLVIPAMLALRDRKSQERSESSPIPFEPSEPPPENALSQQAEEIAAQLDQAVSRLDAAARWIEKEEPGAQSLFRSRSSRLKPLRDISSEIQRASTPHPRIKRASEFDTQPEAGKTDRSTSQQKEQAAWPWFGEEEEEEKEGDLWENAADPLLSRARPTSAEAARIEDADMQRIALEEHLTLSYSALRKSRRRRRFSRWQLAFGGMVILALVALAIDGLLLTFAFNRANHALTPGGGPPTLALSSNVVNAGAVVSLQITHFAPLTTVVLTHDVQEALFTIGGSSAFTVDASGAGSVSFTVNSFWGPGFHLIAAEDVATRYTASATLQVNGEGPSRPPHLLVASSSLDLGSAAQGADTIQSLVLRNAGDGSISWSVSSDQPWLLLAPLQGTFSTGQTIAVAVQRSALPPGPYDGSITLSSNVSAPEKLHVHMTVKALPPDAGPMISLVPPLLSFTTVDGSSTPVTQVVTLSNPGQQRLHWSLSNGPTATTIMQNASDQAASSQETSPDPGILAGKNADWLHADTTTGWLAPGQTTQIHLTVNSQSLLPGAYAETLTFRSAAGTAAFDTPQMLGVALTVQPHCGLLTSTGSLDFTAVADQSNPSSHALSLNTTSSCASDTLNWQAQPSAGWITVSPASGQVSSSESGVTSIGVNTANLRPGKYSGLVTFLANKSTQTVFVWLNLQPHPAPLEPIMSVSPMSLNFSTIQGQASPGGQMITLTNNGGGSLKWHAAVTQLNTNWLSASPGGGIVPPGQTGQVMVNVATTGLTPGNYSGQITLIATDMRGSPASGGPQTIAVDLVVQPPCALAQPSQSALLFNAIAGGANPLAQMVTLTGAGSCVWPLQWSASVSPAASWLTLAPATGTLNTASQQGGITVGVNAAGLQPGTYNTQVTINALDSTGTRAQNSPQTFTVTLTVQQPCTLQTLPSQLTLSAAQGQSTPASQTLNLSESGSCGGGVAWTAVGNMPWLSTSPASGTDNGGGSSFAVSALAGNLTPGNYTGQVTVSASNNGMVLQGSPQTISVIFQVTGYTVSGSVVACSGPAPSCATSSGLAGATVSLINSSGITIATVTADNAGNFTFANIPLGNYTISASGTVGTTVYTGATTLTVSGSTNGLSVQTFASS